MELNVQIYSFIVSFLFGCCFYYMLDLVDSELYSEAMIVQTEWKQQPRCIMCIELEEVKTLGRKR